MYIRYSKYMYLSVSPSCRAEGRGNRAHSNVCPPPPQMFVAEPDTTAQSARHGGFVSLPLLLLFSFTLPDSNQPTATAQRKSWSSHSVGRLGTPWAGNRSPARMANWEGPMLRVSCRLAFFLMFPEHNPLSPSFFLRLNQFQSR